MSYVEETINDNDSRFLDKQKDVETDLHYFGARYFDAGIGRFTKVDPVGISESDITNPQRFNRYAYSLNNPYKYIDPNGKWPTKVKRVHSLSINRVLSHISELDRSIISEQQISMDADQSSAGAYKHAMSAPGQLPYEAWEKANKFVHDEITTARDLEQRGKHEEAFRHLGNANHTMQDSTSPAHKGFQEWDELSTFRSKLGHVKREFYDPGSGSDLDSATKKTWDAFKSNQPIPKEMISRP